MIINGKEVNIDYRAAQTIQQHLDVSPEIPETAKVEVSKKDIKELNQTFDSGVANYNEWNRKSVTYRFKCFRKQS